jgi:hypothetical protein
MQPQKQNCIQNSEIFAFQRDQKGAVFGHSAKPFVVFAGVFSLRSKLDWTTDWPNWSPELSEIAIEL